MSSNCNHEMVYWSHFLLNAYKQKYSASYGCIAALGLHKYKKKWQIIKIKRDIGMAYQKIRKGSYKSEAKIYKLLYIPTSSHNRGIWLDDFSFLVFVLFWQWFNAIIMLMHDSAKKFNSENLLVDLTWGKLPLINLGLIKFSTISGMKPLTCLSQFILWMGFPGERAIP